MRHVAGWRAMWLVFVTLLMLPAATQAQTPTVAPPEQLEIASTVTVQVALESGTPGAALPPGVPVTLYALDAGNAAYTREGTSDVDGVVRFEDVPHADERGFGAAAKVGATTYVSEVSVLQDTQTTLTLPIKVFATTTDTSKLGIADAYVFIEPGDEGFLKILNAYVLSNSGDRTIEHGAEEAAETISFPLPLNATDVRFEDDYGAEFPLAGGRYGVRFGVPPGEGTARFLVSYSVPFTESVRLETSVPYHTGKLTVIATQGITLTSSFLTSRGSEVREDGVPMSVWDKENVQANQDLALELRLDPVEPSSPASASPPPIPGTAPARGIGFMPKELAGFGLIGAGLLVALVASIWAIFRPMLRSQRPRPDRRRLIRLLADLEEDRETGSIDDKTYAQHRALIARALDVNSSSPRTPAA